MAKQLNVNLSFGADISKAKQQIQELQKALQVVAKLPGSAMSLFDDTEIRKASQAALELEQHLSRAVNVNTGKLDLSRFSNSLKANNKSLNEYATTLLKTGEVGQQAFLKLAQSIAMADTPVARVNAKLAEMGTALKNTARWQISSSILHGFMGALQSAYRYSQDLNESLNDIRIVTGYNIERMDKFAEKANKTAKALSATTLDYTNASLIYFQQGLSNSEVEERTAVTIKMANAAGQSAETISDQMTAVWNNFYDGSKSLEYYADVMTALGAATASSTDEISEGLNKFAAIAETVGLSYEYAASALATVTATTRQSADVVGTAFKTLFARLQDLELGETLDDGTSLGKYSAALDAVGINIKTVNGDMKDMDQILDELGDKWKYLSKDTQIALAQTVAGTRQYTQLVALMDNWDYFQENLGVSKSAEGTLDQQAAIYAESWEAAQDRVAAAAENIYQSLLDDDFFIDLLNGLEKVLETIGGLTDGLGGLRGVVNVVGSVFLTMFAKKMPETLNNLKQNFMVWTGQSKQLMEETQKDLEFVLSQTQTDSSLSEGYRIQLEGVEKVNAMKQKLVHETKNLTAAEREEYEAKIRTVEQLYKEIAAMAEKKKAIEETFKQSQKNVASSGRQGATKVIQDFNKAQDTTSYHSKKLNNLDIQETQIKSKGIDNLTEDDNARLAQIERLRQAETAAFVEAEAKADALDKELDDLAEAYRLTTAEVSALVFSNGEIDSEIMRKMSEAVQNVTSQFEQTSKFRNTLDGLSVSIKGQASHWKTAADGIKTYVATSNSSKKATQQATQEVEQMRKKMTAYVDSVKKLAKENGIKIHGKTIAAVQKAIEDMDLDNIDDAVKAFDRFATTVDSKLQPAIAEADQSLDEMRQDMLNMKVDPSVITSMEQTAEAAANADLEMSNVRQNVEGLGIDAPKGAFHASEAITEFGSSIMAVSGMITSIKSSINIFGDESATTFEKVGAAISILMAVTSAYNAVQTLSNTLLQSKNVASAVDNFLTTTKIGATIAQTAANWGLNASMLPVLLITLAITAAIAALVAIVWLVVKAFEAWKASTPEAKLKAAEEEASRLSEELTKAKDAANELRESIESYDTAIEKIKTLKEGTEEWRKAIQEANDIARQMIDENEGLEGKYHFNAETGLIEFDRNALKDLQANTDARVHNIESQKIRADNAVLSAKSNVSIANASKTENYSYWDAIGRQIKGGNTLGLTSGTGLGAAADEMVAQAWKDSAQQDALTALAEAYQDSDGSFADAINSLNLTQRKLIKDLGMTDSELSALCQEVKNNTDAAHENTKQLIHNNLSGDYDYDTSEYKDFIADAMATDLDDESARLYEEKYKDQWGGMTDAEIQKQYAEMMGWDTNLVQNKGGNKAIYINEEGEEVTISDEMVRRALAQSEAQNAISSKSKDYIKQANQLADIEKDITDAFGGAENVAMDNYDDYIKQVKAKAKEAGLTFTDDEIEKFIQQNGSNTRTANQITLKDSLKTLGNYSDAEMTKFVETMSKDLSDEQLQLAIDIAATAESVDDFARQFEQAATEAFIDSLNASADQAKSILDAGVENRSVDSESLIALGQDESFQAYLEEQGESLVSITASTYSRKMTIIAGYYSKLKGLEAEALEINEQNYKDDLASYEAILQYKEAYDAYQADPDKNTRALDTMKELAGIYNNIDFTAYMDMDISDIHAKMDEIENSIEEIEARQISLNMEWETTDVIDSSLEGISELSKAFENDMVKVGNSYKLTAAQLKDWAKQYPDLFSQAKESSDGIMEINAEVVDEYLAGQEAEVKSTIEANIAMLEANYAKLESDKKALELEKQMAISGVNLETITAEQMMNIKQKLTQYYIDSGMDEVKANQAALTKMGVDQETYNTYTAALIEDTASDMIGNFNAAAEGSYRAFSNLWERIKSIFKNIGDAIDALISGDWEDFGKQLGEAWMAAWEGVDPEDYVVNTQNDLDKINIEIPIAYTPTAEKGELESIEELYNDELNIINAQMESIMAEIVYNKALLTQDLADFGNTDIEDGTESTLEDLIKINERYHEINRQIARYETLLDRVSKKKDRAYGNNYLNLLKQEKQALESLYEEQNKLFELQSGFLAIDRKAITDTFEGAVFGDSGEVLNYTALLQAATDELNKYKEAYNQSQSDADKDALEKAEKRYDEQVAILEQYEETLDAWNDQADVLIDLSNQIQDNNLETITKKLEFQVENDETTLSIIEYYTNKMADDFFSMAESIALLIGENDFLDTNQLSIYTNMFNDQKETFDALVEAYRDNKISQEAYISQLKEMLGTTIANAEALKTLDDTLMNYYGDTLAAASEELAKFTSQMEHQSSVLDHYKSIMTAIGKEVDYKSMGVILKGQSELLGDQYGIAKQNYEMLAGETQEKYNAWQKALEDHKDAEAELYRAEYEAALQASNEAQNKYLELANKWAEALKAELENALADLDKTLEEALTGGTTFDRLNTTMERTRSLQEEYLTTTNKVYETNKLMRQAQQEIDKISNTSAKRRLQAYIQETQQLQGQSKLSQYELEIQQAKYDLLLAEIALEEAQNAKSTVRLQRDSEGNFGYVYTADQNAIDDASQNLADAQNSLYNLGLQGANEYTEKIIQLNSEMYDKLVELHKAKADGEFKTEEEYQEAVTELQNYWNEQRMNYSNLYSIALTTDSAVVADAWSTDVQYMIDASADWSTKVNDYVAGVTGAFADWEKKVATIASDTTGKDLGALATKVEEVTDKSKDLVDVLNGVDGKDGLLKSMQSEFDSVTANTGAYAKLRSELQQTAVAYDALVTSMKNALGDANKATYHSYVDENGKEIGHYSSAEEAAKAAWEAKHLKGTMSAEDVNNLVINSYLAEDGEKATMTASSTVGDYSTGWQVRPNVNTGTGEKVETPDSSGTVTLPKYKSYAYKHFGLLSSDPYPSAKMAAQNAIYPSDEIGYMEHDMLTHWSKGTWRGIGPAKKYLGTSSAGSPTIIGPSITPPGDIGMLPIQSPGIIPFASGGYTGAWGSYGKLAMLHEKELVLNKNQTQDFLLSMEVLERILQTIDLQSINSQIGGILSSPGFSNPGNGILEQNVHIEASFPNATNHSEIEEAFGNLVNLASQYANRK